MGLPVMLKHCDAATVTTIGSNRPLTAGPLSGDAVFATDDLSWRHDSPFRPVDWRWRLAQRSLVEKMPRRPELQDPWVRRITKHLRSRHEVPKSRVSRRTSYDPILAEVSALRFAADPLIGGELEALILTGEPRPVVAEISGLDEPVVEAYEQCFFDVRPKLEAWSYVIHIVIGPGIYEGFRLDDLPPIWKTIAYFRGRYSLAVVLQAFPGTRVRPWPDWYPATQSEQRALIAACKRMVYTRCLRLADMSPADLFRFLLLGKWLQDDQEADCVKLSGIGAISKVDVTSLIEPRTEDLDSITAASCSSPVSILRGGCAGARGGGTSDGNKQAGAGTTDLDLAGKPVEPAYRVTA